MDRRRSVAALCVVLMMLGAVFAGTAAARRNSNSRGEGDFLSAAGSVLGPGPSTRLLMPGLTHGTEKIHINAKITCEGPEPGDHLHIHGGEVQFKASVIMGDCPTGEDDDGEAEGTATGLCNGQAAEATFYFSTSGDQRPVGPISRQPTNGDGDFADVSVQGIPPSTCSIEGHGPLKGNIKFHDKTPDPEPTESD